jgi:hypothetical protein
MSIGFTGSVAVSSERMNDAPPLARTFGDCLGNRKSLAAACKLNNRVLGTA